MDVVLGSQKLESAGHLLGKVAYDDLVEAAHGWVGVLFYHALGLRVVHEIGALLDEG
jgi:hypothetical protein